MKTEKKKKKYDLNNEIKELTNWEASGYKLLVETMAGFKYTIKIINQIKKTKLKVV